MIRHDPGDEDRDVDRYCCSCGDPFDHNAENAAGPGIADPRKHTDDALWIVGGGVNGTVEISTVHHGPRWRSVFSGNSLNFRETSIFRAQPREGAPPSVPSGYRGTCVPLATDVVVAESQLLDCLGRTKPGTWRTCTEQSGWYGDCFNMGYAQADCTPIRRRLPALRPIRWLPCRLS